MRSRTHCRRWLFVVILLLLLSIQVVGVIQRKPSAQAVLSDPISDELAGWIEDVPGATAYRYHVVDSAGHSMDTAKIIADAAGGYLAVYHTDTGSYFEVHLATSTDLMNWTYQQTYGPRTHQPYLAALTDGGFLLANEADQSSYNWIQVRYFPTRSDLLANRAARTFVVPHTRVPARLFAEGTPNIYRAILDPDIDHSRIEIGFHYWKNGDVDRQARGTLTNFTAWVSQEAPGIDDALVSLGVRGNIGDRDNILYGGRSFNIHEGQLIKGDFGSWRPFLWEEASGAVRQLTIHTHQGSQSFANSSFTLVPAPTGAGQEALVVSHFIPSENSAPGEAGQLIYYRILSGTTSR